MIYSIITSLAPYYNVCTKIEYKGFEISIASDSSCKENERILTRTDLRVYKDDIDVTEDVCQYKEIYRPTLEDIIKVKDWIDNYLMSNS